MQGDVMKESMRVAKTVAWNIIPEDEKQAVFENTKHYQDNWKKYSKSIF